MSRLSPLGLAVALLRSKPLVTILNIIIYATAVFSIVLLIQLSTQVEKRLRSNSKSIDLVVGAKGSPLQLVLSALYHLDAPTGNIALSSLDTLRADPLVRRVIPLSVGDSVRGYRIVGSEPEFLDLYSASILEGKIFEAPMQALLGSEVAQQLGLKLGDTFVSSHGLSEGSDQHTNNPFKVVGILKQSGGVIDRLCLTSLESVWQMHQHHESGAKYSEQSNLSSQKQVTAALIQYKSPIAAATLPRKINSESSLQAASPAVEITRLMHLLGLGVKTLQLLSSIVLLAAILSALIALTNMLDQRRLDFAIMRAMGASVSWVISTVVMQGVAIAVIGTALGVLAAHLTLFIWRAALTASIGFAPDVLELNTLELCLLPCAVAIGALSAALPAFRLYRQEVAKTLAQLG